MPTFNLTTNGVKRDGGVGGHTAASDCRRAQIACRRLMRCPPSAVPGDRVSASQIVSDLSKAVAKSTGKPETVRHMRDSQLSLTAAASTPRSCRITYSLWLKW